MTNLYFQVASFFFLLLITIIFFNKKRIDTIETKTFAHILRLGMFGIVMDIIVVFVGYYNPYGLLVWLLNKLYFAYVMGTAWLLFMYFISISYNKKLLKNIKKIRNLTMFINILLYIIMFFAKLEFYNENNIMYSFGASVDILMIIVALYFIGIIFILALSYKNLKSKKYFPIYILIILLLIAFLVRYINPGLLLTTTIITYVTIIMYFTIENPDVKIIEQLKIANQQVEKANRAKTDFLSSMSHEIRTPLNAIIGFSECIKEENNIEVIQEDANDIIIASETLLEIVNGILDISKIEANKMEVINSEYDLIPNMKNVAKLIEPRIANKDIEFNYSFAPDIPRIMYGDISKLKQIVTNLLTNAAKYTTAGRIDFNISCINEKDTSSLVFSIKDTGRGIKEEQLKKLFTKFQRLDEDKNTTIEGTGLGLAITKSLVEMLGGKIIAKSKYTEGSEFIVYLNQKIISLASSNDEMRLIQDEVISFDNYKVLLVDDNPLNLKVATRLLKKYSVNPICLTSGLECIEKVKLEDYDLILLDDMMPKLSGKETLVKLKELENFNIPVVALTANAIAGMKKQYIDLGFDNYLAKPIDKTSLVEVLKKYYKPKSKTTIKKRVNKIVKQEVIPNKKTVLIVDDNITNIKITSRFLSKLDVNVVSVTSGKECLEKIENKEVFDLILMDDMMPELSGVETFELLKEKEGFKTPVIALTANAIEGARNYYLEKGFNDYIPKPIDLDLFLKTLKGILKVEEVGQIKTIIKENNHTSDYLISNGVDLKYSLDLLGDMEMYDDTVKDFLGIYNDRLSKINSYKEKDMKNYAIEVHALKSDCKYLGFLSLADIAYEHELKSKANDIEYVHSNCERLLVEYKKVIEVLTKYIG